MALKKSLKFLLPEEDKKESSPESRTFRKSLHPGSNDDDDDESQPRTRTFRKSKFPGQIEEDDDDESRPNSRASRKSKSFAIDEDELQRKSRISTILESRNRYSTRLTQMFANMKIRRERDSLILIPAEIYLPTYRMESKKSFDPRIIEDFIQSRIKTRLDQHGKFEFDNSKAMHSLGRSISEQILAEVKSYEFDRYKIFVSVIIGQKMYQGFNKSIGVLWEVEKDTMATFVYERNNIFGLINVFGVYFD